MNINLIDKLFQIALEKSIKVEKNRIGISLLFSDGNDAIYFDYDDNLPEPTELEKIVNSFIDLDKKRTHIINAIIHLFSKYNVKSDFNKGRWNIYQGLSSSEIALDFTLTDLIKKHGELGALKNLIESSWYLNRKSLDDFYLKKLLQEENAPAEEIRFSQEEYDKESEEHEKRNEGKELKDIVMENVDEKTVSGFDSFFGKGTYKNIVDNFMGGLADRVIGEISSIDDELDDVEKYDELIEEFIFPEKFLPVEQKSLNVKQLSLIDEWSENTIESFKDHIEQDYDFYNYFYSHFWFKRGDDNWADESLWFEYAETKVNDSKHIHISDIEFLLRNGKENYKKKAFDWVKGWVHSGAHDLDIYFSFASLFYNEIEELKEMMDECYENSNEAGWLLKAGNKSIRKYFSDWFDQDEIDEDLIEGLLNNHAMTKKIIEALFDVEKMKKVKNYCLDVAKSESFKKINHLHSEIIKLSFKMNWLDVINSFKKNKFYKHIVFSMMLPEKELVSYKKSVADDMISRITPLEGMKDLEKLREMILQKTHFFNIAFFNPEDLLAWTLIEDYKIFAKNLISHAIISVIEDGYHSISFENKLALAIGWTRVRKEV